MSFASGFGPTDLQALFTRFRVLYGYFGAGALKAGGEDAKQFTNEWWAKLRGRNTADVARAADNWIAGSHDKWPTPGQLLKELYDAQPAPLRAVGKEPPEDRCPCGCAWGWYRLPNTRTRWLQACQAERRGLPRVEE